ncbi:TatD family hydrolase [Neobacillus sp. GCM10023253]|uniref:TatD family hydrolase n=1 Tax=Neobacillus sp. GCM10023253 TaxID=3252644 RepID=UPI00361F6E0E
MKLIDAHIHLDKYKNNEIDSILAGAEWLEAVLAVSYDLESCKRNLQLSRKYQKVKPVFGFHPEQGLPSEAEFSSLIDWMTLHRAEMIAVGEVGLPYYLRQEQRVSSAQSGQYIELLEIFVELAKNWEKPIVLHAVYGDAPIVCDLLEKHSVEKAHFHWFKGDDKTIERMIENGYFISVTPEIVYKEKIQRIAQVYPIEQMMVETDGPWPFEGPFLGKITNPVMMKDSISMLAKIKKLTETEVSERVLENTQEFYSI